VNTCKSMVAWLRAMDSLSTSKIFHTAKLPKFHVVHSYLRSDVTSMTNLQKLMNEIIIPRLSLISSIHHDAIEELKDWRPFKEKKTFSGTIHCEASLMALVYSFSGDKLQDVPPFTQKDNQELEYIFSVSM
jgi:hypothetical protein